MIASFGFHFWFSFSTVYDGFQAGVADLFPRAKVQFCAYFYPGRKTFFASILGFVLIRSIMLLIFYLGVPAPLRSAVALSAHTRAPRSYPLQSLTRSGAANLSVFSITVCAHSMPLDHFFNVCLLRYNNTIR